MADAKSTPYCPSRVLGSVNRSQRPETEKTGAGVKGLSPAPSVLLASTGPTKSQRSDAAHAPTPNHEFRSVGSAFAPRSGRCGRGRRRYRVEQRENFLFVLSCFLDADFLVANLAGAIDEERRRNRFH